MQLAAAFRTAVDRLARRQAATLPAMFLRTRRRLSRGPKLAVGEQVRVVLCKNFSEERKRPSPKQLAQGLKAAVGLGEHLCQRTDRSPEAARGTRAHAWAGGHAVDGEHPPFIALLAISSWNCNLHHWEQPSI